MAKYNSLLFPPTLLLTDYSSFTPLRNFYSVIPKRDGEILGADLLSFSSFVSFCPANQYVIKAETLKKKNRRKKEYVSEK
jgi:hypothetical protein